MIINKYVISEFEFIKPAYRLSPFRTSDILENRRLPDSQLCDNYLRERFCNKNIIYTITGKEAIFAALKYLKLKREDIVTILTTSNNYYISKCVTNEIEKFCSWSRKIEKNTAAFFVIHEFGYPYKGLEELKKHGIPIIEDSAYSFFSEDSKNTIGRIGDFVVFSLPKIFPIQIGGLLLTNNSMKADYSELDAETLKYVKNVISYYIKNKEDIIHARLLNYNLLKSKFETLGFPERFELSEGIVPGVFMLSVKDNAIDLPELKKYFFANGIECSVFYGENGFFIPCHQNLIDGDLEFFYEVFKSFIKK